ncbi:MAG TPA: hypothetical protein VNQ77_13650 [Frankiaceae bacterium]|nr:hypothetical protein [Frankiaceae bacterium]
MRLLVAVALSLAVGCSPGASPPRPDPAVTRQADVDALVSFVEATHPEPFAYVGEAAWRGNVASLRERAGRMSADEYLVALAEVAHLGDRNGHGGVFPADQPALTMWPVRMYDFADGWHVIAARDSSLVGARVQSIGGRPVEEVAEAFRKVVPRDNPQTMRARLATYLMVPAFLRGLGVYGPLGVVDTSGVAREVTPEERPAAEYAALAGLDVPQIPPALPRPSFAPKDEWFWTARRGSALVVGYERVAAESQSGRRVQGLVEDVRAQLRAERPSVLVVDIRRNPGGDTGRALPLTILLRDVARAGRVPVRVLVGRGTYSAASLVFLALRREAPSIRFYGEATGGGSRTYGNPSSVTLPGSGIVVQVPGARAFDQGRDIAALVPDVPVRETWAAYKAGQDPVLDAALG